MFRESLESPKPCHALGALGLLVMLDGSSIPRNVLVNNLSYRDARHTSTPLQHLFPHLGSGVGAAAALDDWMHKTREFLGAEMVLDRI